MDNSHIESDIAMLLMQIENEDGNLNELYSRIQACFAQLRADGEEVAPEFAKLEKELGQRFAA